MNVVNIREIRDGIHCSHASSGRKASYGMNAVNITDASNNRNASNIK